MRGDAAVAARLIASPRSVTAVVAMVAGAAAVLATLLDTLPWYEVEGTLEMLGGAQSSVVASLAGWRAHPWVWLVPALATYAVVVGGAAALDRAPVRANVVYTGTGVAIAALTGASALVSPPVSRFDAPGTRLREYLDVTTRLPSDVDLTLGVRPGAGLWLSLAGAALLVAAGMRARGD